MKCKECYSENPRITPLRGAEPCLSNHLQYICSSCGRCICIGPKGVKKARCLMPFGSLQEAMLYLKAAEIMNETVCGIYELTYKRGDKRYRIFKTSKDLETFLKKSKTVTCDNLEPVYISKEYVPVEDNQVRHLTAQEVRDYLAQRKELEIKEK